MFLGWVHIYVFAVILSALLLIYNIYCFIGLLKFKKAIKESSDVDSIQTKFNIYAWFLKRRLKSSSSSNKGKTKLLTNIVRKVNIIITGVCAGALVINIVMLTIVYMLNIQATNISNLLSTLFGDKDCCCYAKCTGDEEDDKKTAYELLFGEKEYEKLYTAMVINPSEKQPFLDMHKDNPNGKTEGEWLIEHLDENMVLCYKAIVGNNNKFRAGDHQDRSKMTNEELKQDLIALLSDYKVGGINPNCDRCFGATERQLSTKCLGEAHWVPGWTWEAIWDSDNPGDGSQEDDGNNQQENIGNVSGGNTSAQNSAYGIQLDDGWYYWYHQQQHECNNNAIDTTYGRYGSLMIGGPSKSAGKNVDPASVRGCSTYATAMALSNVLSMEITPWQVVLDVLKLTPQYGKYGWYVVHDGSRGILMSPTIDMTMYKSTLAKSCKEIYGSYGLDAKAVGVSQAEVDEILAKKGMVVYSFGGGPKPYYSGRGHFMVIRYKDENGLYYLLNSIANHDINQMNTGLTWGQLSRYIKNSEGVGFWNTNPPSGGNGGGTGGGDYASQIIDKMRTAGYNDYSISGALGNFVAESGLDPKKTQGNACNGASNSEVRAWQGGKSGRAIGFAQWDGSRAIQLLNAADSAGVNWYDFNFQLNFYMAELSRQGYGVADANSNCSDVEHAAWYFTKKYERCGTCKYAPCGGSSNGQHGVGANAANVSYENRNHINGFNTRSGAAHDFYNKHFK